MLIHSIRTLAPIALAAACLAPSALAGGGCVLQEIDGLVVAEIESRPAVGGWVEETSVAGYTGDSYYRWAGPDLFNQPGSGILTWQFDITNGGNYQFRIRNHHDHPDTTLENDVWVRLDGQEWIKVFSAHLGYFDFQSLFDFQHTGGGTPVANFDLSPGLHTLEFSGRSFDYRMDRWHLFQWSNAEGLSAGAAPSGCVTSDGPFCFGTSGACPCGNGGAADSGCDNSFATGGGKLGTLGTASVSSDSLVLAATGLSPSGPGLYFQGTERVNGGAGSPFGDGLRCVGGSVVRLGTRTSASGSSSFGGGAGEPLVSVAGSVRPSGGERHYQVWYRNVASYCTPDGFNLTNGVTVTWTP